MLLSRKTYQLVAPTRMVHVAMLAPAARALPEAKWFHESMQNHQMCFPFDHFVKKFL